MRIYYTPVHRNFLGGVKEEVLRDKGLENIVVAVKKDGKIRYGMLWKSHRKNLFKTREECERNLERVVHNYYENKNSFVICPVTIVAE